MDFEEQILSTTKSAVHKSISEALSGYNNPLTKLTAEIVEAHKPELKTLFEDAIVKSINSDEFKKLVQEAFQHKMAKALVSSFSGTVDKAFAEMKADPTIKAKAIIAVENIIKQLQSM